MEFVLPLDTQKFRSTNAPWNKLMLNDPWSVGYVTTLIALQPFARKEDWEAYYYASGAERELLISQLDAATQNVLQDESLVRLRKNEVDRMDYPLKNLNTQYGRTEERLFRKGEILFAEVKNNGFGLTVRECFECVRFRVIGETWNGVMVRERNTLETLRRRFPTADFRKAPGEMDHQYAVDFEVYKDGKLAVALQIKPPSYTWNAPYIQKARNANRHKNQKYFDTYKVQVLDIIADSKGKILNPEVLKNL